MLKELGMYMQMEWQIQLRVMDNLETTTILLMQHFQIIQLSILEAVPGLTRKALEDSIHMAIISFQKASMVKM